jgi:hypothetical protein
MPAKPKSPNTRAADIEVALRVTLVRPPAGVQFSLGGTDDGKEHETKLSRGRDVPFDLVLRARGGKGGEPFRMMGIHAHGPPAGRFIPIGVGKLAGQSDSCWERVIKVWLTTITPTIVDEVSARKGARLVARVNGTGKNGEPVCATVPLLDGGWKVSA